MDMRESLPRTRIRNSRFPTCGFSALFCNITLGKGNVGKEEKISANIDCVLDSCQAQCQELYLYCFYVFLINNLAHIVLGNWESDKCNDLTKVLELASGKPRI